jgi:hypothetical protein
MLAAGLCAGHLKLILPNHFVTTNRAWLQCSRWPRRRHCPGFGSTTFKRLTDFLDERIWLAESNTRSGAAHNWPCGGACRHRIPALNWMDLESLQAADMRSQGPDAMAMAPFDCTDVVQNGVNCWIMPVEDSDSLTTRMARRQDHAEMIRTLPARTWQVTDFARAHAQTIQRFLEKGQVLPGGLWQMRSRSP